MITIRSKPNYSLCFYRFNLALFQKLSRFFYVFTFNILEILEHSSREALLKAATLKISFLKTTSINGSIGVTGSQLYLKVINNCKLNRKHSLYLAKDSACFIFNPITYRKSLSNIAALTSLFHQFRSTHH